MKFTVTKASNYEYEKVIEIKSIKQLLDFIKKNGPLIIKESEIIIYDAYVE